MVSQVELVSKSKQREFSLTKETPITQHTTSHAVDTELEHCSACAKSMRFERTDTDQESRLLFLLPSQIAESHGGLCPIGSWCPELARPRTPEPAICSTTSLRKYCRKCGRAIRIQSTYGTKIAGMEIVCKSRHSTLRCYSCFFSFSRSGVLSDEWSTSHRSR